jgi:hypothetical protein
MMSLSQVLSYNTEHLVDAAAHWQGLADQREEVFAGVRNDALGLPWEGQAADALHQRTGADYNTAMDSAGNLRQAAMIANDGASTLDQMHSRVLYTLEDAQADGFAPTEDLGFVDTRPSGNAGELAQRQAQAQQYAGTVKTQVAALYTHDTQVGSDLTGATAGEGKIQFTDFKADGGPVCDDPSYNDNFLRKFLSRVGSGGIMGGLIGAPEGGVGAIPGMIIGGASGGIEAFIEGVAGDGPKCK